MEKIDPIELSQKLMRCASVTPVDDGALDVLQEVLEELGFKCERMVFSEEGTEDVDNLYARLGEKGPNLCFAGHTDVVPPGDLEAWDIDPFEAKIIKGELVGRGASDMKCAIAAWIAALSEHRAQSTEHRGSLSLLITGDEEGPGINGTRKVLQALKERGEVIDSCIVGEPTNPKRLGEMIKHGRRGSVNFTLTVEGVQGHSAYPHLADNPLPKLLKILRNLTKDELDKGTDHFDASNLEITSIDVGNNATNVIPAKAIARFNIRFNDLHTCKSLQEWVTEICDDVTGDYTLETAEIGEAFVTNPGKFTDIVISAVETVTGLETELSTTGGTSDARFIKDYAEVVEFGLINETAHKVNEFARTDDIELLSKIYQEIIKGYF